MNVDPGLLSHIDSLRSHTWLQKCCGAFWCLKNIETWTRKTSRETFRIWEKKKPERHTAGRSEKKRLHISKNFSANAWWIKTSKKSQSWPWPLENAWTHCRGIYHFLIKLCGKGVSCVPKVCSEMGLYQCEIITKPCLINENMTRVSELIYQKGHAPVSDESVANGWGGISSKKIKGRREKFFFFLFSVITLR